MLIRDEREADFDAIAVLIARAFEQENEARLVDALRRDGDAAIALVATEGDAILGHILFSPMAAPFRALGLAPLAVEPAAQRRGIGGMLVRAGLDRARAEGWEAVVVLGDPEYYRRFGFRAELAAGFDSPYAGPHLMALVLRAPLPATSGRIAYAPAFMGLE